ncbi:MAG: hypothetical protein WDM77_17310 [Steroidobacteraceae bacterium]
MRALRLVAVTMACAAFGALACGIPAFGQGKNPDDLQPGVNTSSMPPQTAAPSAAASSAPAGKAVAATAAAKSAHAGKSLDRLDLDTTQITGNKELPKVMYVVPWKHSDLGDLTGKPANSLIDEVLQPVDRDVFNREERYYHTVAPQKSPADPPSGKLEQH